VNHNLRGLNPMYMHRRSSTTYNSLLNLITALFFFSFFLFNNLWRINKSKISIIFNPFIEYSTMMSKQSFRADWCFEMEKDLDFTLICFYKNTKQRCRSCHTDIYIYIYAPAMIGNMLYIYVFVY
jgi:hypothetical protein